MDDDPFAFWLIAKRSGFFPYEWQYFLLCLVVLFLPTRIWKSYKLPKIKDYPQLKIVQQIFLASSGLFILSHVLLFRLHLPSRYTQHTWRIVIALTLGIVVADYVNNIFNKIT